MDPLIQTTLILGIVSAAVAGLTLYQHYRNQVGILFAVLCLDLSVWSLSYVTWLKLEKIQAIDIHWIANIWISPISVLLLNWIFTVRDKISPWLMRISIAGALVLSVLQAFLKWRPDWIQSAIQFWPIWLFVQLIVFVFQAPDSTVISKKQRPWIFAGIAASLATCNLDHVPWLGNWLPSIGNLFVSTWLIVLTQAVAPQRWLKLEVIASRFFAMSILSLFITGFFALLFTTVSHSFPLFLLNSFLASFLILILWPLLSAAVQFVFLRLFQSLGLRNRPNLEVFSKRILESKSESQVNQVLSEFFSAWFGASSVWVFEGEPPKSVQDKIEKLLAQNETPLLHRTLILTELQTVLDQELSLMNNGVLQFLEDQHCDWILPYGDSADSRILIMVRSNDSVEEVQVGFGFIRKVYPVLGTVQETLKRIAQTRKAIERDRLVVLGEMSAGLAHEIRNPLNAIQGSIELLDQSNPWIKIIQDESKRMNRLVDRFMDLSKSRDRHFSNVNIRDCIDSTVKRFQIANPKFPKIDVTYGHNKMTAHLDPDGLDQVVSNLLENAMRACESKENSRITIKTQDFREWVQIIISDNGIGIEKEKLDKIFAPFFSEFAQGTGLGLSIVHRIVQACQGRIEVQSEKNIGTVFTVSLPSVIQDKGGDENA